NAHDENNRLGKRGRAATASTAGRVRQRMAVSASSSPFIGEAGFASLGDAALRLREGASELADTPASSSTSSAQRLARPVFPPQRMVDVDGNTITVPPHMLNAQGQPMYSSITPDTMCRIRYPHARASLNDLGRRAKQMLEWLGKTQSEYEQERLAWLEPRAVVAQQQQQQQQQQQTSVQRVLSIPVSEAATSPIGPDDWPDDAEDERADGAEHKHPRSTLSLMESLVWRLIRFQEAYGGY
ncbi:hypothetical protein IW150_004347, partial [Coemansia sp. RSA 2607]